MATGNDSPDSAAWPTIRSLEVISRRSAGIRSPAASFTTSPGTTWSMGTSKVAGPEPPPARRCTAQVVVTSLFSAAAARPERYSCQKRSSPLTATITERMTTPGSAGSCHHMTAARKTRTAMNGFQKAFASCAHQRGARSWATTLAPCRSRRSAASACVRPLRVADSSWRTRAQGRAPNPASRSPASRVRDSSSAALRSRRPLPGGASLVGVRGVSMVMMSTSLHRVRAARSRAVTWSGHGSARRSAAPSAVGHAGGHG